MIHHRPLVVRVNRRDYYIVYLYYKNTKNVHITVVSGNSITYDDDDV